MKVRYFEGLAQHLLTQSGHPTVKAVEATQDPGLRVVFTGGGGVTLRFVRGSADRGEQADAPEVFDAAALAGSVGPVDGPPSLNPAAVEQLLKTLLLQCGHDGIKGVQTFTEWGKTTKPHGLRVECADGSEIYATFPR